MDNRRRRLLAMVAAGGMGAVGGCSDIGARGRRSTVPPYTTHPPGTTQGPTSTTTSTASPTATETPASFDRVVDMVADMGVDSRGNSPIDAALQQAAGDGRLLEFPPGEYLVTEPLLLQDATNFGIRGTGSTSADVRFVHPKGYAELFLNIRGGANSVLENFTVDQTADRTTNSGIIFLQRDGLTIADVEIAGFTPSEGDNPDESGSINLLPSVTDPAGTGTITRFRSVGGGEVGVYPDSYPGIYTGTHHRGTLRLVDSRVENCGGAGVYMSRAHGPIQVEGGLFRNNGVAQVRLAGKGSYLRGATIVVDTDSVDASRGSYETVRGVWWESGDLGHTGGAVENCTFIARSSPIPRGLLEIDGTAGAMTVQNSTFQTDRDGYFAIYAARPGTSTMGGAPDRPWGITVRNVEIRGAAAGRTAIRIDGRRRSLVRGTSIEQSGANRDGIVLVDSPGSRLANSTVAVSGFPIRLPLAGVDPNRECLLSLRNDVTLRTSLGTDVIAGNRVGIPFNSNDACLGALDVEEGALVVLDRCAAGFVGGVVGGTVPPGASNPTC